MTVNPDLPVSVSIVADPSGLICSGSNVTLTASALPATPPAVLISEGFNNPTNNWTKINNTTGGFYTLAAWTLHPDGYSSQYSGVMHSNDNSQFYFSNSDTAGSGSVTSTILQSPVFSTVNYTSLSLSFYHYFRVYQPGETGKVQVSTNGTTWTDVNSYTSNQGSPTAFANATINLDAYIGNTTIFVRFKYDAAWGYYWAIDNVSVSGTPVVDNYNYSWTASPPGTSGLPAGAGTPSAANVSIIANPTASTTYTVTASSGSGCDKSNTINVTITPLPVASISYPGSPFANSDPPQSVTMTGTLGGTFTASPAGISINASTGEITPATSTSGTYLVTYTIAASGGCSEVTATSSVTITGGGIITVSGSTGADGTYTSLTNTTGAFAALNAQNQAGNTIEVTIEGSSIHETGINSLNAGAWTTLTLYPIYPGLTVSGNIAGPLLNFNGADNVTIDGRVNQAGSTDLSFSNTSASASASTSTFRFINSAENNTIQYCTIKGSETNAASGIIFFSASASGNGNDGNILENNTITADAAGRPINAIYSLGTSLSENTENTISNNNVYNFFNRGISSNGINLGGNTSAWTITGNSFYETTSFAPTAWADYNVIKIDNISGGNYDVSDNFIGGSSASCSGNAWTKANSSNNIFYAIYLNTGTAVTSNVQNNTIQNINWSNSGAAVWTGIHIAAGNVNIGSATGNKIGAETGTGSITVNAGDIPAYLYGINIASSGLVDCQNNSVGSITAQNSDPTKGYYVYGINKTSVSGTTTLRNNLIGSEATSNSIAASSASTANFQFVTGINSSGTGSTVISGNTVANLTNGQTTYTGTTQTIGILASGGSNTVQGNLVKSISTSARLYASSVDFVSAIGIAVKSTAAGTSQTVSGNTVNQVSNTDATQLVRVCGIFYQGPSSGTNQVSENFINNLSISSSDVGSVIDGIVLFGGLTNCFNNIISLGTGISSGYSINGIWDNNGATNNNNIYFNTVYIGGTVPSGVTSSTAALKNAANTSTRNYRNNLLVNTRSGGTTGKHYAVFLIGTTGLTINYNDYFVSGTNGMFGSMAGTDRATLALWKAATAQDVNSLNINPAFSNPGGNAATDYSPTSKILLGISIAGITKDYSGNLRSLTPTMGAFDGALDLIVDVFKSGVFQATYYRVKDAFDKLNDGTHTGQLDIRIKGNTSETASAVLNASGSGSASYSTINIYPTTSGISVTGNLDAPLIDFNGSDNITLDGRVNATGTNSSLVISNSSIGVAASTIRFINSSDNNTVKYCFIKGSETSTTQGVIFFSTSASGNGNDGNTISNNNITSDAAGRPVNAIYSRGATGFENSGNTISNNAIYNFFKQGTASNGVSISTFSTAWTIAGNSFYETTAFIPTASVAYSAILISNTLGINFTVSDNYIGGTSALCGGTSLTKTNAFNNTFSAISLNVGIGTSSNVQNNTIQNITWSNSGTAVWTGINIVAGDVNVGTTAGNTVGASSGVSSITVTGGATASTVYGINLAGTGVVVCQNNIIGAITAANAAANASNVCGINKTNSAGTVTISNNAIGSAVTANSINATSGSTGNAQSVFGISSAGTGTIIINSNTISNLTNSSTNATTGTRGLINGIKSTNGTNTVNNNIIYSLSIANANSSATNTASVCGIVLTTATLRTVSGNTIYNLANTYISFAGNVTGIYFTGGTGNNVVSGNFIHSLSVTGASSTTASLYGIKIAAGATTYYNNIISLGGNTKTTVYGFYETGAAGNNNNLYFNTINISGSLATGTTNKSYALFSGVTTNVRNFRNNIFVNTRTTTGGASLHYAAYFNYTTNTNLTLDYNDYFVSGIGGVLGFYNAANKTSLPIVTGKDASSLAINPMFVNGGGTNATDFKITALLGGITGTGVTTDFGANLRNSVPSMGAWERILYNRWKGTISNAWNIAANWTENVVPAVDDNILFDDVPVNHCQLDQNRSVSNVTNAQSAYRMVTNGFKLTIKGSLNFTNGAQIDATAINSTLEFAGSASQTIPAGAIYNSEVYSLTVNNSNGVSLGGPLRIIGILTAQTGNLVSNGNVTLVSTATRTALISGTGSGEVTGNVTMQRYLPSAFGYKYFSSPFQAATVNEFADDMDLAAPFPTFYDYLEDNHLDSLGVALYSTGWLKYVTTSNLLIPMKGYAANFGSSAVVKTVGVTGVVTNGIMTAQTLYNHNRTYTKGFNLAGNPYPSPINWDATSGWTKTNVDNAIYLFDAGTSNQYTGTYSSYINGTSSNGIASPVIPSMQGFFVHVTNGSYPVTATFGMDNRVRVNNLSPVFHKSTFAESKSLVRLAATFENEKTADPTVVYFDELATKEFDTEFDALKLMNTDVSVPNLFGLTPQDERLSISAIPFPFDSITRVPLGLKIERTVWVTLSAMDITNMPGVLRVFLSDEATGLIQDLQVNPTYRVHLDKGTIENRFALLFSENDLVHTPKEKDTFSAYMANGKLFVFVELASGKESKLVVSNMLGQVMLQKNLYGDGSHEVDKHLPAGIYVLSLFSQHGIHSQKIYIPNL
jgi:hypothetical protein